MSDHALTFTLGVAVGVSLVAVPLAVNKLFLPDNTQLKSSDQSTDVVYRLASSSILEQLEKDFRVPIAKLHDMVRHFTSELNKGLHAPGQTIKALPSYVTRLPTGHEQGTYLALDLGGTNLRVCDVYLEGHGKFRMRQKKYKISEQLKTSSAVALFDFIADAIASFLDENSIDKGRKGQESIKIGFTFSFPVDQTEINRGRLMHWNKGFDIPEVVDNEVVGYLEQACDRKNLAVDIVALVNDTVGTLIAHHYVDPETYCGVIIGTGTNAAYVEKISNVPKWKGGNVPSGIETLMKVLITGEMVINIEWGGFDIEKVVLPITKYDTKLDKATENPGKQLFEKMISGMYLGEIARLVLMDLVHSGEIFRGKQCPNLSQYDSFQTQFMSRIERDHSQDLTDTKAILEDLFGITETTLQDRQIVKRVCELVGIRSARLSAAAVAAVVSKMNRLNGYSGEIKYNLRCTVAIDGSVFEHYPHFRNRMIDALREVFGLSSDNVDLELARDGSGVGAALIAAVMGK